MDQVFHTPRRLMRDDHTVSGAQPFQVTNFRLDGTVSVAASPTSTRRIPSFPVNQWHGHRGNESPPEVRPSASINRRNRQRAGNSVNPCFTDTLATNLKMKASQRLVPPAQVRSEPGYLAKSLSMNTIGLDSF